MKNEFYSINLIKIEADVHTERIPGRKGSHESGNFARKKATKVAEIDGRTTIYLGQIQLYRYSLPPFAVSNFD